MDEALSTGWIGGVTLVLVKDLSGFGETVVLSSALMVSSKEVSACWCVVEMESSSGGMTWTGGGDSECGGAGDLCLRQC